MKKILHRMKLIFAVIVLVGLILPASAVFAENASHEPITLKLINLLEKNLEIKKMLEASIKEAKKKNPDQKTNPAQSLEEYYDYIDRASKLIPQQILENPPSLIRDQILQSICYFYFLVDQGLPELQDMGLFKNAIQYYEPFSSWLRDFAITWGDFLDTKESWNEKYFQQFYSDPQFGLQTGWYESPFNWKTFNQFFARYLRSPCERPIGCPCDPAIVVSPADSEPQGTWPIDENSNIRKDKGLKVKLVTYYNVNDLLAKESKYKGVFANGVLTHTFLNVFDYHRYHFAVGGTIKEKKIIQQNVTLEVEWDQKEGQYVPVDSIGWQFFQTRGYVIVDTREYGLVALIPMGMAHVSSVNFEDDVKVGSRHEKGDMLGNFLFGGSDFVMLFQEKAGFKIMVQKKEDKDTYKHILVGAKYGVMNGQN